MNVFENATNSKKQGDIGEARAVYEYTRLGYTVCTPHGDSARYDLIIEKDGVISRVQVKTSTAMNVGQTAHSVSLITTGGNQKGSMKTTYINHTEVDIVFVLVSTGDCYGIPAALVSGMRSISVGNKWVEYKL